MGKKLGRPCNREDRGHYDFRRTSETPCTRGVGARSTSNKHSRGVNHRARRPRRCAASDGEVVVAEAVLAGTVTRCVHLL